MRWLVASYLPERAGQPGRSLVHISPTDLIWLDGNAVFSFTSDALRPCVQLDKLHQPAMPVGVARPRPRPQYGRRHAPIKIRAGWPH